jgi:hypothetical protein
MRRGSQMRGEVKSKIRLLVLHSYKFRPGQSIKTREHNLKRAAALKEDLNFTYKVSSCSFAPLRTTDETCARQVLRFASPEGNVSERKYLYQNDILQNAINAIWFANRSDEGVVFSKFFEPISLPTITLVLTAVSTVYSCHG